MLNKLKALWAEAIVLQRIVYQLMKKIPLPLILALSDGNLTSNEVKNLIQIATEVVTEELTKFAKENLNEIE